MTQTMTVRSLAYVRDNDIDAQDAACRAIVVRRKPAWIVRYRASLLALDLSCIVLATILGYGLRFALMSDSATGSNYVEVSTLIAICWIIALQAAGGYDIQHLATGPEEAKRVFRASVLTASLIAIVCYATKTEIARGYVVGVIPAGIFLLMLDRTLVRAIVRSHRQRGEWSQRIVAVGTADSVRHLLDVTERVTGAGLRVVAACIDDREIGSEIAPGIEVTGGVLDAAAVAARIDADVIAVTGHGLGPADVRELGWRLEGSGRGLVLAPALTEIAGPRVQVSPVEGLPLVWLEQPKLGRLPCLVKRAADIVGALVLILLTAPILIGAAIAIKITSRGPIFFRQVRLGLNGSEFSIVKFRSMYVDAHDRRGLYMERNEQDGGGVLFKIRSDPRVTPVGRWLRRLSIDELPQLVDVLRGTMSLVGPRPLAAEDSVYTGSARRRLLVRPGLTGLWQVSGRSELSWDDAVRLDLYYVENWSLGLDISILLRTMIAVAARRGAY